MQTNHDYDVVIDISTNGDDDDMDGSPFGCAKTELDSHTNMSVEGKHSHIINQAGKMVEVNLFTLQYKTITAEVVDAILWCDYPYEGKSYLLVV